MRKYEWCYQTEPTVIHTRRTTENNMHRIEARILNAPADYSRVVTPNDTTEVFCDFAEQPALTNFDGNKHFCQFCGSTEHKSLGVTNV